MAWFSPKIDKANARVAELENEKTKLAADFASLQENHKVVTEANEKLTAQVSDLTAKLSASEAAAADAKGKLDAAEKKLADAQPAIDAAAAKKAGEIAAAQGIPAADMPKPDAVKDDPKAKAASLLEQFNAITDPQKRGEFFAAHRAEMLI